MDDYAMATVIGPGSVGKNKACDVERSLDFEAISKKDKEAIAIGLEAPCDAGVPRHGDTTMVPVQAIFVVPHFKKAVNSA